MSEHPEVEQLRSELEQKLPQILVSFNKILGEHGLTGVRVLNFTLVPESTTVAEPEVVSNASGHNVMCNEDSCVVVP